MLSKISHTIFPGSLSIQTFNNNKFLWKKKKKCLVRYIEQICWISNHLWRWYCLSIIMAQHNKSEPAIQPLISFLTRFYNCFIFPCCLCTFLHILKFWNSKKQSVLFCFVLFWSLRIFPSFRAFCTKQLK